MGMSMRGCLLWGSCYSVDYVGSLIHLFFVEEAAKL